MKKNPILFYDLETTGLDAEKHFIIEIAAVIATPNLESAATWNTIVEPPIDLELDDVIIDMHMRSGLLDDIRAGKGVTLWTAEQGLLEFLDEHSYHESIVLAGHSPHTVDLSFTKQHLPRVAERLSHRVCDTGALIRTYQAFVDPSFRGGKVDRHRALDDALGALDELKRWAEISRRGHAALMLNEFERR